MNTALLLLVTMAAAEPGWQSLFDGRTFDGWHSSSPEAWTIEDGCFKARPRPRFNSDLISAKSYGDFEFEFEWRISPGGNSGVKYRIQRTLFLDYSKLAPGAGGFEGLVARELAQPQSDPAKLAPDARADEYVFGFEFQLLDDSRNPEGKLPTHRAGALYSMLAPTAQAARPAGEWNQSRLVVKGSRVEHWINGVQVLQGDLADPVGLEGLLKRWGKFPDVARIYTAARPKGAISLQNHGDAVWFRNLRIRER